MTSGLQWFEGADDIAMSRSMHWEQYVLDRPMARAPGTAFGYNSGGSHLLSAIMRRLTGDHPLDYAKAQLFGPLGTTNVIWTQDHQGNLIGGTGLLLLPRDM